MSKLKLTPTFKDYFGKAFRIAYEEELDRIKAVQQSIKHPHFEYAVYDMNTGEVTYKRKKATKILSGKRIVRIIPRKIKVEGASIYEDTDI